MFKKNDTIRIHNDISNKKRESKTSSGERNESEVKTFMCFFLIDEHFWMKCNFKRKKFHDVIKLHFPVNKNVLNFSRFATSLSLALPHTNFTSTCDTTLASTREMHWSNFNCNSQCVKLREEEEVFFLSFAWSHIKVQWQSC